MKHPTTNDMLAYLPPEIKGRPVWSDLEDVTALTPGDWVFDPSSSAFYAGRVTAFVGEGWTEVRWFKSVDNIFTEFVPATRLLRMWWIDPAA